jgi:hypothetical protein
MALDTATLETDLDNMVADLPATLQIGGQSLSVAAADLQDMREMQPGGFESVHILQVTAARSDFTALPTSGMSAYINSTLMRVDKVLEVSDRISVILDLIKL